MPVGANEEFVDSILKYILDLKSNLVISNIQHDGVVFDILKQVFGFSKTKYVVRITKHNIDYSLFDMNDISSKLSVELSELVTITQDSEYIRVIIG